MQNVLKVQPHNRYVSVVSAAKIVDSQVDSIKSSRIIFQAEWLLFGV